MMELVRKQETNDYGVEAFLSNFVSPQTRKAYERDLKDFFEFLSSKHITPSGPQDVTTAQFLAYRSHLETAGLTPTTITRKFSTVRSLWAWFMTQGHISIDPASSIKLPKAAVSKPTQAFSDAEVVAMLDKPDLSDFHGAIHRMALVLLFHTGMRRSELTEAKWGDIYEEGDYHILKIRGKGGKLREIPLSEYVLTEMRKFKTNIENLSKRNYNDADFILQSDLRQNNTKSYNTTTLYRVIKRYAKRLNIVKDVSPHSCRATVITKALEEGAPITEVADLAGHSTINTTQIYWKRRKGFKSSPVHKLNYDI